GAGTNFAQQDRIDRNLLDCARDVAARERNAVFIREREIAFEKLVLEGVVPNIVGQANRYQRPEWPRAHRGNIRERNSERLVTKQAWRRGGAVKINSFGKQVSCDHDSAPGQL